MKNRKNSKQIVVTGPTMEWLVELHDRRKDSDPSISYNVLLEELRQNSIDVNVRINNVFCALDNLHSELYGDSIVPVPNQMRDCYKKARKSPDGLKQLSVVLFNYLCKEVE